MKRWLWLAVIVAAAVPLIWWLTRPPAPREVPFARAGRKTLVSTIVTNGKVEPEQFAAVRAPQEGAIVRVTVEKGQTIAANAVVAELDSSAAQAEVRAAEARVAQARAELKLYEAGGSAQSRAELAGATESTRVQLDAAKREATRLERLVKQNAETRETLTAAQDRVRQLETELASLQNRQAALLPVGGREAAEARVREAQVSVESARRRIEQSQLRAPVGGTVYNVAVKKGAFVRPGDLIAEVGQIRTVRVTVYVDEPELGKVGSGMPVEIRWDAQPGRTWPGTVDRLPTQIVSLNTRQVGEVLCLIDNKEGQLPPGANVNVEIRSATAENALAIPKAAIRRDNGTGVLILTGDHVEWRPIKIGITSVTDAQVNSGLQEKEAVALPTETPLKAGEKVTPRFP
jgi:multidrug resistance efflux pump